MTKQVQGMIFSRKTKKLLHPSLSLNNISLKNSMFQKHLELTLDARLNFVKYIKKSLQNYESIEQIPTSSTKVISTDYIQNIYQKSDYTDVLYDQLVSPLFMNILNLSNTRLVRQ